MDDLKARRLLQDMSGEGHLDDYNTQAHWAHKLRQAAKDFAEAAGPEARYEALADVAAIAFAAMESFKRGGTVSNRL